ncbi:hypothetical protein C0992_007638 [Termitomyces sp. T32_za158]|nr:hypothetical protein C0992_007638 [Termitomyces sp. T32_za158]
MPVLLLDPNEAVCLDFASQDYAEVRKGMIGEDVDEEAAIALLVNAWNVNNAAEKVLWARQRREQEAAQRENERQVRGEDEHRLAARGLEEEAARNEERKKYKNKYMDVSMAPPPMALPEILSTYATSRLQKGLYIELWYFTNKGLDFALKTSNAMDDNTVVQSIDKDRNAVWVTAAASKGSKTVQEDKDLSWEQLSIAIPRFLDAVTTRLRDTALGHPRTPSRPPQHPAAAVPPPTALPPSRAPGFPKAPTLTPAITASTLIDPTQPRSPAPTLPDPTSAATRITITPGDHFRRSSQHPTSDH